MRTVIWINYLPDGTKEKVSRKVKGKAQAYVLYHQYKHSYDSVVVLDEDWEYVDESEL